MTKLRLVGFFSELSPHGLSSGGSLRSGISNCPQENEEQIVTCLRNGKVLIACPGFVRDVLNEENPKIGGPHTLTDGVWAWPNDLPYYVEKYHVRLPGEFIAHLVANDWTIPQIIDLKNLEIPPQ